MFTHIKKRQAHPCWSPGNGFAPPLLSVFQRVREGDADESRKSLAQVDDLLFADNGREVPHEDRVRLVKRSRLVGGSNLQNTREEEVKNTGGHLVKNWVHFFGHAPIFFRRPERLGQFGHNVLKSRQVDPVTTSFNTITGQMTEMYQRKENRSRMLKVRFFTFCGILLIANNCKLKKMDCFF